MPYGVEWRIGCPGERQTPVRPGGIRGRTRSRRGGLSLAAMSVSPNEAQGLQPLPNEPLVEDRHDLVERQAVGLDAGTHSSPEVS